MNRLASIIVICSILALYSCQDPRPAPASPTPVNLAAVRSQSVLYYDDYPSTTQALSQVDLHAQVTGYITGIYFNEGTHVHKGEKLYAIDERLYQAAYDQAAANVKVAQGNEVQAQQDADRYQYLIEHNAVARQTLDHAVIALQNAKNEVAAGQQALKTAATNLTYSVITAPFDGTVGFSQVKLGNLVNAGSTVLNTVSTDDPMAVDFLINEAQLDHYEQLQKGGRHEPDSLFTIVLPSRALYPYPGKISVIDRAVDPQTGTIRVRLVFPNPRHELRAGMSCVVRVHNLETSPQILIPARAIVEQMGEYFVYLAKDSSGTHRLKAEQVKVETGQTIGSNILIRSGLHNGDKIVVDGVQALHDGSPITTTNKP